MNNLMNLMVYIQIDHNFMGFDASTFLHSSCIGGSEYDRMNDNSLRDEIQDIQLKPKQTESISFELVAIVNKSELL